MATKSLPRRLLTHRTPLLSSKRPYHSSDHPPPPGPFTPTESAILSASVPHIPLHGFTPTTLALGAKDSGYIDASTNLFPRGAYSLVHWHLYTSRTRLKDIPLQLPLDVGIGKKVQELTWSRLLANSKIAHKYQEALALISTPSNLPTSLKELHALADEIWYLAGDISVDSSWYTKRASLSSIYAASELFMTQDRSEGFGETREFLLRRFRDAQVVGGVVGSVGQWVGFTAQAGINVLRSKGIRI